MNTYTVVVFCIMINQSDQKLNCTVLPITQCFFKNPAIALLRGNYSKSKLPMLHFFSHF